MSTNIYNNFLKAVLVLDDRLSRFTNEIQELKRLHLKAILKPASERLNDILDFAILVRSFELPLMDQKWKRLFYLALLPTVEQEEDRCVQEMGKIIQFLEKTQQCWKETRSSKRNGRVESNKKG